MSLRERIAAARARLPPVYWTLWVGTLVNRLGGFVAPLLTFYLTEDRGYSLGAAGVVVACYGGGQVVAALAGGVLAGRLGRRATMALSMFGGAATMLVIAGVRSYEAIAATVFVLGFMGDLYRPAVAAAIADVVPARDRVYAYGLLYWCINIGFAIAPILGGFLARFDFTILFIGDAVSAAAFGVLILLRVPETKPPPAPVADDAPPPAGLRTALADRSYLFLLLLMFGLTTIAYQSMVPLSGYMLAQGHDTAEFGAVMAVNGIVIVALQPWITARIEHRDPSRMLALAGLITGAGFALHGAGASLALHATAVAVWTIGEILTAPTSSALVAAYSPPEARGRYQGLFTMAWGASCLTAPLVGAWVLRDAGPTALWVGCLGLGALVALGHLVAGPVRRRRFG